MQRLTTAMVLKIPKTDNRLGLTMVEMLIIVSVIIVIFSTVLLVLNPARERAKAKDNKRLSDIALLDRVINEYLLDNGSYPDIQDVLRDSTSLPDAETISLDNSTSGWIDQNLSKYTPRLPLDPINDTTYKYEYIHTANTYELNAVLEELTSYMQNDSGNNTAKYEFGNNLLIIN